GQLHRKAGVENVRRGHALMDEAGVRPDEFGKVRQEGDDVVLRLAFELVDAGDVELSRAAAAPARLRSFLPHHSELSQCIAGMRLDLEPNPEFRLLRPDGNHFGSRIARDHEARPDCSGKNARSLADAVQILNATLPLVD